MQAHTCYRTAKGSEIPVYYRVCPKSSSSYLKKGMLPHLQGTIKLKAVSRVFGRTPRIQGCSARAKRPICRHVSATLLTLHTCTPMFIAELFIIARTWKQPRCPSADQWIRKLWYIYTMEYSSAIKKNTFESVLMRWMKLEPII